VCLPHEYIRGGTAKLLTLFRPATGEVRAKGVPRAPNAVLHPGADVRECIGAIGALQGAFQTVPMHPLLRCHGWIFGRADAAFWGEKPD
jgi:hypothetical protein